jgi:murein DD-endopeptidase MepM/ murein hydrolase activator NlpD
MFASSALFAGAAHALNEPRSALFSSEETVIEVPSTAVLKFERPMVQTFDTTPKKPDAITVQSATETAKRPMDSTLSSPMVEMKMTSPFGTRVSPITGAISEQHLGQDFSAACGTPVYASDSGKVVFSGWHEGGGGNRVEINHGNGVTTSYSHMASNTVHTSDIVDVGAIVGFVGTTGSSTGCHLHFETIKDNGSRVDPMGWKIIPIKAK